jgi:hypothetical protein
MTTLTKAQVKFLLAQCIAPSQVFDASFTKSEAERKEQMTALDMRFYYGGAICLRGGHTLRSKAGGCIQCDTSRIAFQHRHSAAGFVYLAYSESKKFAKVGLTKNHPQDRAGVLRVEQYANALDWQIVNFAKFDKDAGKVEFAIHSRLKIYIMPVTYEKYKGHVVTCREVFSCSRRVALRAFGEITKA